MEEFPEEQVFSLIEFFENTFDNYSDALINRV